MTMAAGHALPFGVGRLPKEDARDKPRRPGNFHSRSTGAHDRRARDFVAQGEAEAAVAVGLWPSHSRSGHGVQATRRRTSHTVTAMSSTESASNQPPSIHWNGQYRLAGW
jgi:hypothetical protein